MGQMIGSAEIDRLIQRGRLETSPTARHTIYREIEDLLASEYLLLPLFHDQSYRFARPELVGLSLSYGVNGVDYASLHSKP